MQKDLKGSYYILFITVIFIWGLNWPIMKLGLTYISPLWFTVLRTLTGAICLICLLYYKNRLKIPPVKDIPIIVTVGGLQIGVSVAFINIALTYTEAGTSSILAYTTPLWVAPLALVFLKEKLHGNHIIGLLLGCGGIATLLLANPNQSSPEKNLTASILLTIAAILWAIAIVHVKAHKWTSDPLELMPFQMALGSTVVIPFAFAIEGKPNFTLSTNLIAILIYNGPIASAFCFWAYVSIAKKLPAFTTAIGSLGIPLIGFISSAVILNEQITTNKSIGLLLIFAGIASATFLNDISRKSNFQLKNQQDRYRHD